MPKMIRDLIPDDMKANGFTPELMQVKGLEKRRFLLEKLVEEAKEARADRGSLNELGDVYAVLKTLMDDAGMSMGALQGTAAAKGERRGWFDRGYVWLNDDDKSLCAEIARAEYRRREAAATEKKEDV